MSYMSIVVIGASGRIGKRLVFKLRQDGRQVVEAAPTFGVNTVTGQGLAAAIDGAQVVVDVSNSPSIEGDAAIRFFETSGHNLAAACEAAGVQHRIALSIVGTDHLQATGYFRAKKLQEELLKASPIPFTILRSTQFFEFISGVVQTGGHDDVAVSPALVQPIAAINVAETLAAIATAAPLNRTTEVAGPERFRLDDLTTEVLTAYEDPRCVVTDVRAPYFGAQLDDRSLLPGDEARIADLRFADWLRQSLQPESRNLRSGVSGE
ncbi:MAG: SDR family oxidoreductase [Phenylobacterium sp.]